MSKVEPATPCHADALAYLHEAAFPPGARWNAPTMALQLGLPGAFGWIAPAGGMILARTVIDEAEILTLAVHPDARRQGLGRALLNAAIRTAAEQGSTGLYLEVDARNTAARALYAASGFVEVGRRAAYYGPGGDALVLRASIACVSRVG